jgi:hypothetical protein
VETDDVKTPVLFKTVAPVLLGFKWLSVFFAFMVVLPQVLQLPESLTEKHKIALGCTAMVLGHVGIVYFYYRLGKALKEMKRIAVYGLWLQSLAGIVAIILWGTELPNDSCIAMIVIYMLLFDTPLIIGSFIHWKHFK